MWKQKTEKFARLRNLGTLFVLSLAVTSCGGNNDPGAPVAGPLPGNPCAPYPNTVWNGTQCVANGGGNPWMPPAFGPFDQFCQQSGGVIQQIGFNSQMRACVRQYGPTSQSAARINGFGGFPIGYVRAGDKLQYQGSACYWTSGFKWSWNSCPGINQEGRDKDGNLLPSLNGFAQGMVASDGTEQFFLGSSLTRTMPRDGVLLLGINTNTDSLNGGMQYQIRVSTCADHVGNIIACP